MLSHVTIRPATPSDLPFLWDMLFEAAFTTDVQRAAWRTHPSQSPLEVRKYLDGWGRDGDAGVVAQATLGEKTRLGAAWYRLFESADRGDGIIAEPGVPELALAVEPEYRRAGVGEALMRALARLAKTEGYGRLRLSVAPGNIAAKTLYERVGYRIGDLRDPARGTSLIMDLVLLDRQAG